ncbi:MAG: VTC domain-containing protein [Actinomycetaceae bacterium]|nr:VTC domain-containing protein [Actinomycetaceae bacterium]
MFDYAPPVDELTEGGDPTAGEAMSMLPSIGLEELSDTAELLQRVDRKYLLPRASAAHLVADLADLGARALTIDNRREFSYLSVYFDTRTLDLYRAAATGRRRRFKVRERMYLDSGLHFLELKTRGPRHLNVKDRMRLEPLGVQKLQGAYSSAGMQHSGRVYSSAGMQHSGRPYRPSGSHQPLAVYRPADGPQMSVARDAFDTSRNALDVTRHALDVTRHALGDHETSRWLAEMLHTRGVEHTQERATARVDSLIPVLNSAYRRSTILQPDLSRLTIDNDLTLAPLLGNGEHVELDDVVVETKSGGTPSVADRLLWHYGVRPIRISKYALGVAFAFPNLPHNRWHRAMTKVEER